MRNYNMYNFQRFAPIPGIASITGADGRGLTPNESLAPRPPRGKTAREKATE